MKFCGFVGSQGPQRILPGAPGGSKIKSKTKSLPRARSRGAARCQNVAQTMQAILCLLPEAVPRRSGAVRHAQKLNKPQTTCLHDTYGRNSCQLQPQPGSAICLCSTHPRCNARSNLRTHATVSHPPAMLFVWHNPQPPLRICVRFTPARTRVRTACHDRLKL